MKKHILSNVRRLSMLIKIKENTLRADHFQVYRTSDFDYYWDGLLYIPGIGAGLASVEEMAVRFEQKILDYRDLYGSFTMMIYEKESKTYTIFTDNSNLHCFFYNENYISDSFLTLCKQEQHLTFDDKNVIQYLLCEEVYIDETIVNGVSSSNRNNVYILKENKLTIVEKGIGNLETKSKIEDVDVFFHKMQQSLEGNKVAIALTGGYDSRLIASYLYHLKQVEFFISGSNEEDSDIIISKKIAAMLELPHLLIKVDKEDLQIENYRNLLLHFDGQLNVASVGSYRMAYFIAQLSKTKDLIITGDGGVLYKDWEWMTDFPFYRKKSVNLMKFFRQRMLILDFRKYINMEKKTLEDTFINDVINDMEKRKKPLNSQSYDEFYYTYHGETVKKNYNTVGHSMKQYAPLWEYELAKYSYALPRRKRFYYNFIREKLSKNHKGISVVKTGYGMSASNTLYHKVIDFFPYSMDFMKKFIRMLVRKVFHKTVFVSTITDWNYEDEIRTQTYTLEAIQFMKEQGYIDEKVNAQQTHIKFLERIITIYTMYKEVIR